MKNAFARESARPALLHAAHEAFGLRGFDAVSLDEISTAAGVTKGSLYHHFASKADLFEAVYRAELERQVRLWGEGYDQAGSSWEAFQASCLAYLDLIREPKARRVAVVEAPAVLGLAAFRRIEDELAKPGMKAAIALAMDAGEIERRAVGPVAHLIFAALCEAAMQMDRADDFDAAQTAWIAELKRMFDGLR
jgi:AcrR family transcriptional regulator